MARYKLTIRVGPLVGDAGDHFTWSFTSTKQRMINLGKTLARISANNDKVKILKVKP